MPVATISLDGADDNAAKLDYEIGDTISCADTGGGTPTSRTWTIYRWPAPLASAPTLSTSTGNPTTFVASTDGGYIINLQRTDNGVITSQNVFAGVEDPFGLVLPCAGASGVLINPAGGPPASQEEGWLGHARAGTNFFLDAIIRFLRTQVNWRVNVETIAATKTLTATSPRFQKINGGAANRDVNLPAESTSLIQWFWIRNAGTTNSLVVKDDTPSTLETMAAGEQCFFICSGTTWVSMGKWS